MCLLWGGGNCSWGPSDLRWRNLISGVVPSGWDFLVLVGCSSMCRVLCMVFGYLEWLWVWCSRVMGYHSMWGLSFSEAGGIGPL